MCVLYARVISKQFVLRLSQNDQNVKFSTFSSFALSNKSWFRTIHFPRWPQALVCVVHVECYSSYWHTKSTDFLRTICLAKRAWNKIRGYLMSTRSVLCSLCIQVIYYWNLHFLAKQFCTWTFALMTFSITIYNVYDTLWQRGILWYMCVL